LIQPNIIYLNRRNILRATGFLPLGPMQLSSSVNSGSDKGYVNLKCTAYVFTFEL